MSTFTENNAPISTYLFDLRLAKSLNDNGSLCTCLAHKSRRNNFRISTSVLSEKFGLSSSRYQMVIVIGEGTLGVQFELQLLPRFNCNVDCNNTRSRQHKYYSGVFSKLWNQKKKIKIFFIREQRYHLLNTTLAHRLRSRLTDDRLIQQIRANGSWCRRKPTWPIPCTFRRTALR